MQEQVAGDVLEPVTADGIIAAGMLVAGAWDQAGSSQANRVQRAITREEELEDLVGTVAQAFLGLTVNCARCHDHKFDPVPLADYHRMKAVFAGVRHGEREAEDAARREAREAEAARWEAVLTEARATVGRLDAEAIRRVLARRPESAPAVGPLPLAAWDFSASDAPSALPGEPLGGATIGDGQLRLPGDGAHFRTVPIPADLRDKTLEAWVTLSDLNQSGGAAISIESGDGRVFDAIVFGERQAGRWMAGSEGFVRTRDLEAPPEDAPAGTWVHLVATYSESDGIALYRNGKPLGKPYRPDQPLPVFRGGDARVVLGMRHTGGARPWLSGGIRRAALHDRALTPDEVASAHRAAGLAVSEAELLAVLTPAEQEERDAARDRMTTARERLEAARRGGPKVYAGRREQPEPTRVLRRGDVQSPGDVVSPGAPEAVGRAAGLGGDLGLTPDAPEARRRIAFAGWLADPRNPLPARVVVNRVWQHHFGRGIVATPNDFGASGSAPTHPELLDWLASEFIARGWSLKSLHLLLVTSATYRQSADHRPDAAAVDADNRFLWRQAPRRLEAEELRDALLAVSGELNPQVGGPSFQPFTTSDYGATFYHLVDRDDPALNRRTVYRMNINSGKDPLLDAFDCPDPSVRTPVRGSTVTPLQALGLMNSPFVQRQARRLAERAERLAGGDPARAVDVAHRLALGRPATPEEQAAGTGAARYRGLAAVTWVLLNSTEFVHVR